MEPFFFYHSLNNLSSHAFLCCFFQPVLKFKNWCSICAECLVSGTTEWNDEHLAILNADKTFGKCYLNFSLEKFSTDCVLLCETEGQG